MSAKLRTTSITRFARSCDGVMQQVETVSQDQPAVAQV